MVAVIKPTFLEERTLLTEGYSVVAGVDEAGCGCWAGPVLAAAVILPIDSRLGLVRDSKTLSFSQRQRVAEQIKNKAAAWAVGSASAAEIDQLNIRQAAALAMRRAIRKLALQPQFILVDGFRIADLDLPQKNIIRGDLYVKSIAAASIICKTERDFLMSELDRQYPGYGFAQHKGYGTRVHQEALARLGICLEHRRSYAPIKKVIGEFCR
ncbi:ribonuclease HII [Patescibacteria group bacterium]|nr:ribonuclease HII [Patescibacteria group bacterium]MBU1028820.1 ribonuclease HII [Patescibacteria group bacterium]MBU1916409.1 ribonuclease HII [Patescibacteria group bacterium]